MNYYVFPKKDYKLSKWSQYLNRNTDKLVYYHNIIYVIYLFIFESANTRLYVRYINQSHIPLKRYLQYLHYLLLLNIAHYTGVEIYWIKHNVDSESIVYDQDILNRILLILIKKCTKCFVLDRYLVDFIKDRRLQKKIDYISFGEIEKTFPNSENFQNFIICNVSEIRSLKTKARIGLCVTNSMDKYLHFHQVLDIVGEKFDYSCYVIIVGKLPEKYKYLQELYDKSKYILHYNKNEDINEYEISNYIDFIYRSVDDCSISLSLYVACSVGIPLVTHKNGCLHYIVINNCIGEVVDNRNEFMLKPKSQYKFVEFLSVNSWRNAYNKLFTK